MHFVSHFEASQWWVIVYFGSHMLEESLGMMPRIVWNSQDLIVIYCHLSMFYQLEVIIETLTDVEAFSHKLACSHFICLLYRHARKSVCLRFSCNIP